MGEVSGGSSAEFVGAGEELASGEPIGDAADGSVDPGADCPPVPDSLPTTITVPAGRSVCPPTVTEPATGLLAETRRSGWVLWLMTCISTGAVPPARYTAAVCVPTVVVREGDLRVADRDAVHRDRGAGGAVGLVGRLRDLAGRAAGERHRARDGDGDEGRAGVGGCTGRGAASRADHEGRPSCLGTPGGTAVRAPVRWVAGAAPGRSLG